MTTPQPGAAEPAVTTWTRLEPRTRSADLSPATEARIADPFWLLARQWQFGEFQGEDAGSPVLARIDAEAARFTRYRSGADGRPSVELETGAPLEAVVEREPADQAVDLRWSAETGQQFLRLLTEHGAAALRPLVLTRYPLPATTPEPADESTLGYLRIMAGRAPDGRPLLAACAADRLVAEIEVPDALVGPVQTAVAAWLEWLGVPARPNDPAPGYLLQLPGVLEPLTGEREQRTPWPPPEALPLVSVPGLEGPAWQPDRLEYRFAVAAAPTDREEVVLSAAEYDGDRLDWYHLDHDPGRTLYAEPAAERVVRTVVPTPVGYPGMPSTRFWELEDGDVNLGAVGAGTADLARMVLLEYGTVYANDHFLVPLDLPLGSVTRIRSLVVTDTFGVQTLVPAAPGGRGWSLFRPSTRTGEASDADLLVLPPTNGSTLHSDPVEEVRLLRDELANLGWAVERTVTGATGRPVSRERSAAVAPEPAPRVTGPGVPADRYTLASPVPEHWVPLVPRPADGRPDRILLHRTPLQRAGADGTPSPVTGHSRLLDWRPDPEHPDQLVELAIPEEEVGRSGVRLVRQWQLARWHDGSVHLWLGRSKHLGGGGAASGLRFDTVSGTPDSTQDDS
ncbi:hypothetical protein ACH4CD_27095 [Streptomyces fungicidicus]|uniref:hypothetical protein n=1 Tax=Streptomyces fungicidicus TaxID=68203 RepID=UPI00378E0A9A